MFAGCCASNVINNDFGCGCRQRRGAMLACRTWPHVSRTAARADAADAGKLYTLECKTDGVVVVGGVVQLSREYYKL